MTLRLDGPGESYVEVVADSVSKETGDRVTSFELNAWRFTLAEWNTHCVFARNSASSRAIPVAKQLERYENEPAYPLVWPAEQKGMQGGADLEGEDLETAQFLFQTINKMTSEEVHRYLRGRAILYKDAEERKTHTLHKSLLNRLLEPMQWHKMLITAAAWENFYNQRCAPRDNPGWVAQPEFQILAELIRDLHDKSDPRELVRGEWHTPYIREDEEIEGPRLYLDNGFGAHVDVREVSAARCARTSYMTQTGVRDYAEDLRLHEDLVAKIHMSPLEHVCTPDQYNVHEVMIEDPDNRMWIGSRSVPRLGKFRAWQQWRHVVEARRTYVSQR